MRFCGLYALYTFAFVRGEYGSEIEEILMAYCKTRSIVHTLCSFVHICDIMLLYVCYKFALFSKGREMNAL